MKIPSLTKSGKIRMVDAPADWAGAAISNQADADERIPLLLQTPAAVRFLSVEPMLAAVDLSNYLPCFRDQESGAWRPEPRNEGGLSWIIGGGESGPHARPCHPDWARSLRDQCQAAGVAFFWKQWGEWIHSHPNELHLSSAPVVDWGGLKMQRVGKRAAGNLLDGREWQEFPKAVAP